MPNLTSTQLALIGTLATLVAAVIAAVVAVLTTRYIVKHGPNYNARFRQMHETLEALARTQDELKQQQAQAVEAERERRQLEERKAEAENWKTTARIISLIEGNQQVNKLSIQSPDQFVLIEAYLLSDSGARLHDYQVLGKYGPSVGLNVIISHESLLKIANTSDSYFSLFDVPGEDFIQGRKARKHPRVVHRRGSLQSPGGHRKEYSVV
jgi:hypothetical protein